MGFEPLAEDRPMFVGQFDALGKLRNAVPDVLDETDAFLSRETKRFSKDGVVWHHPIISSNPRRCDGIAVESASRAKHPHA